MTETAAPALALAAGGGGAAVLGALVLGRRRPANGS